MAETTSAPSLPRATVRLQLHEGFGFDQVIELIPYFSDLGISHIYTSPFLMARPGSTHGYDITDHNRLNPEIGDAVGLDRLTERLHAQGMGLILDFVPNHMGIGADNPWWLDVLEWGRASPFARFFDIDWMPADPILKGKVLLPVLGDHYGAVLEAGDLKLCFDAEDGSFSVRYFDHRFPIAVRDYAGLLRDADRRMEDEDSPLRALAAEFENLRADRRSIGHQAMIRKDAEVLKTRLARLAVEPAIGEEIRRSVDEINGTPGHPASFRSLHKLLEGQAYRVAFWRVATTEINYRRFFDINDLAGLRMEEPALFEVSHQLIFRLIADGKIQGLRLDHIDGLFDPAGYCRHLQDRSAYLMLRAGRAEDGGSEQQITTRSRSHPLYLLVEKILARHEHLRDDWPVDGTTGYEFMNLVNGLFVDPRAETALTLLYRRFTGLTASFEEIGVAAKRQIVETSLASELHVLASNLHGLARQSWSTRDYTFSGIRSALVGLIAQFPVYRTYITEAGPSEEDRRFVDWATAKARKVSTAADISVFDFLHAVLTTDLRHEHRRGYDGREILRVAMKFQQLTGPVMAKAVEDTAFYRYFRLVSLNEVGGQPANFGTSVAAFHHLNRERLKGHPFAMLATATHDHKRGEDARLRIDAISELTPAWVRGVRRWAGLNRFHKREVDGIPAPDANDEYLIYQTLLGVWPMAWETVSPEDRQALADRLAGYLTKALREAKTHTGWTQPNAEYEAAAEEFARALVDPAKAAAFATEFDRLAKRVAVAAACHGLSQTMLKATVPGVPDVYRGTEFWDLSLVDPDNRRPVDYAARRSALQAIDAADPAALLSSWHDGRIKQFVLARTLGLRRQRPALFADGTYQPIEATGRHADHVIAFQRRLEDDVMVVVAPRLCAPLVGDRDVPAIPPETWDDTAVDLSDLPEGCRLRDCLTGRVLSAAPCTRLADMLTPLPLACLASAPG